MSLVPDNGYTVQPSSAVAVVESINISVEVGGNIKRLHIQVMLCTMFNVCELIYRYHPQKLAIFHLSSINRVREIANVVSINSKRFLNYKQNQNKLTLTLTPNTELNRFLSPVFA